MKKKKKKKKQPGFTGSKLLLFTKENRNFFKLFKKQRDKHARTNIDVYGQTYMYDAKAKYLQEVKNFINYI